MTHAIYTAQQLQHKSIARLKQIYSEIACTVEVSDKRCKDSWITAIADYQASKIQKLTATPPDNQAIAQTELNHYIATQAQAIAPEELTTVEISFYDHEIYCGKELIASITHDDDLTQPWVVMLDGKEKFRANTWARCHRFIQWHLNNSQLPSRNSQLNSIPETRESVSRINKLSDHIDNCELRIANCELVLNESTPAATETPCTAENQIMAHIFNECQNYGFEILDDGIYNSNGVKLGQVGCTDSNWWVINNSQFAVRNSQLESVLAQTYKLSNYPIGIWHILIANCELVIANCFVRSLSMVDTSLAEPVHEYLQNRPLEQLTTEELQQLFNHEVRSQLQELVTA